MELQNLHLAIALLIITSGKCHQYVLKLTVESYRKSDISYLKGSTDKAPITCKKTRCNFNSEESCQTQP